MADVILPNFLDVTHHFVISPNFLEVHTIFWILPQFFSHCAEVYFNLVPMRFFIASKASDPEMFKFWLSKWKWKTRYKFVIKYQILANLHKSNNGVNLFQISIFLLNASKPINCLDKSVAYFWFCIDFPCLFSFQIEIWFL